MQALSVCGGCPRFSKSRDNGHSKQGNMGKTGQHEQRRERVVAQKKPKLTALEKNFAREYVLDHNGTRAAIRAGYAAGKDNANAAARASRLLKKQEVRDLIAEQESEIAEQFGLTRDAIINRYNEIYERCMDARPVLEWDSSKHAYVPTGIWQFDARGAMKALGSIAVMAGVAKPRAAAQEDGYEELLEGLERDRNACGKK